MFRRTACLLMLAVAGASPALGQDASSESGSAGPQVFLDKNPKIVAYQLRRLSNAQLLAIERHDDQPKYKPVYQAILTRKGVEKKFRQEAVAALAKLNQSDAPVEILAGVGAAEPGDKGTLAELVSLLMAQKPEALAAQREKLASLASESENPTVKEAAYAALAVGDGKPDRVWQAASDADGGVKLLLGGLPMLADPALRASFYEKVRPLVADVSDAGKQTAAIEAISYLPGHEADDFKTLAGLVESGQGDVRNAAARSIRRILSDKWPKDVTGPLAQSVVKILSSMPGDQRTTPEAAQLVQLGTDLAATLPADQASPVRKALRELGVQVVVVQTMREQVLFDLRYFAVQAGKPVQIVVDNVDAMPHNFVVTAPGALQEVSLAGAALPAPADPKALAYVPDSPKVLHATILVQPGESLTQVFDAPKEPGEYPFVCTFPGHSSRMYGTMLVVADLEAWEQNPKVPTDPMTGKPYESQKHVPGGPPPEHEHH